MTTIAAARRVADLIRVAAWRRVLVWRAQDVTARSERSSCLVLAAHPVDEVVGCAAKIARKRATNTRVTVVIATDGRYSTRSERMGPVELAEVRTAQATRAAEVLGVTGDDLVFLPHDDRSLVLCVATLVDELTELIGRTGVPDEVLVTSALDGHTDHVALHDAACRLRPMLGDGCRLLEYPTGYWYAGPGRSGAAGRLRREWHTLRRTARSAWATPVVRVKTAGHLTDKRRALACYASGTAGSPGEATWGFVPSDFFGCFLGRAEVFFPVP
jgi:LmbE family N-acetylglucosaminyl deacetylase